MILIKECRGLCYRYYPHAERDLSLPYFKIDDDGEVENYKKCMQCEFTMPTLTNDDVCCKCCRFRFRYRAKRSQTTIRRRNIVFY